MNSFLLCVIGVIIEGSYLLAVISDYLSGLLVSLDDLYEFMDITRESTFHSNSYVCFFLLVFLHSRKEE